MHGRTNWNLWQRAEFSIPQIASVYHQLMLNLGYPHYIGQGGDWGSLILRAMALAYPGACIGIHLNFLVPLPPTLMKNPITLLWSALGWFTPEEKKRLARMQWWIENETGYQKIHGTKPQTICYGLLDSPVGMLAWIGEKLNCLVEPGYAWDKEMVITWTMLYLLSGSSWQARIYKEAFRTLPEAVMQKKISSQVAFGVSCFPFDVYFSPRWWAKAMIAENIVFWKEHSKGGHFPSIECSEVLKADIWEFVRNIPEGKRVLLGGNSKGLARL